MGKYVTLKPVVAFPFDADAPDLPVGTVLELDERDPAAKAYLVALKESPGVIVDAAKAKSAETDGDKADEGKPKK